MMRHTRYSSPNGRGKNGRKLKAGGVVIYQDANRDTVSPAKLEQLIKTFQGDYPRINIDHGYGRDQDWGDPTARRRYEKELGNVMANGGSMQGDWSFLGPADQRVRRDHGDHSKMGMAGPIRDFFMKAGGLIDRPYSPSTVGWPHLRYLLAPGGQLPSAGDPGQTKVINTWKMDDDTPSTRPGYRTRSFSNSAAYPEPDYPGVVSRGDYQNNTGAFADPRFDFSLNQARSYFEGNPNATGVRLGRERTLSTGESMGVNPAYPLTRRYDEYREAPMTAPTVHPFNLRGLGPHTFSRPIPHSTAPIASHPALGYHSDLVHTPEGFDYRHNRPAPGSITQRVAGGELDEYGKGGKWIQGAVNPAHKGYCTPMTKSTCTGRRRAFAQTMKKHHGFHADGGKIAEARKRPGGSNVGKKTFSDGSRRHGPYAGPSGGSPAGSYPIPNAKHARAALALARHAPNPAGIRAAVHRKFPNIGKKCTGGSMKYSSAGMSSWKGGASHG